MSVETLKTAVGRMKSLLVNENFDYCRKANTIWCEEHFSEDYICKNCITEAFQHVLDAFERERELVSEREYDRGYKDGKQALSADEWVLEMERCGIAKMLKGVTLIDDGSHAMLSEIAKAVYEPPLGWTRDACELLRKRLIQLIGGCDTKNEINVGDVESLRRAAERDADVIEALNAKIAELEEKVSNLTETGTALQNDFCDLSESYRMVMDERDALRAQLAELDMSGATHTYKMLKEMLGEAKNAADSVRSHIGRMVETGKELNRLKSENAMYRRMLNDAAQEYKTVIEENRNMEKGISMLVDGLRHAEDTVGE